MGKKYTGPFAALVAAAAIAGCADESIPFDRATIRTTFDTLDLDSRGVRTVEVVNRGYDPDAGPAFRLVERLRVGSVEGTDHSFGRPEAVAFDGEGKLWVLDDQTEEASVFDRDGRFLFRVGGRGRGPSEFYGATELALGPGDTVWVPQVANRRYTLFGQDGTLLGSRRRELGTTGGVFGFDEQGRLWDSRWDLVTNGVFDELVLRRDPVDWEGPIDTLRFERGSPRDRERTERFRMTPYGAHHRSTPTLSPRGSVWAHIGRPLTLIELDIGGSELRRITLPDLPLRSITDSELEEWKRAILENLGRADFGVAGADDDAVEWLDETHHPQVEALRVDGAGRIWAFDQHPTEGGRSLARVFGPEGRYLGEARADFDFLLYPLSLVGDSLVIVGAEGPRGEPQVVVAEIEPVVAGSG